MKALNIIKYVFSISGAGLLILSFTQFKKTLDFLEISIPSQGTVVELIKTVTTSSSDESTTFKPMVKFEDEKGNKIEFLSSSGSNPPGYHKGETVEVLYNPQNPHDAKIDTYFSIWGGTLIIFVLGIVFFAIGTVFISIDRKKKKRRRHLKLNGTRIESDFLNVQINDSIKVNGRSPFQLHSQWKNPSNSKVYVFSSDFIWFDPTDYIKTNKIYVLIDKNDPKNYLVDLSFLPQKG